MRLILGVLAGIGLLSVGGPASACFVSQGQHFQDRQIACAEILIKQVQLLRERVEGLEKTLADPGYVLFILRDGAAMEHVPMSSKDSCHSAISVMMQNEADTRNVSKDEMSEELVGLGVDSKFYHIGRNRMACFPG